MGPFLKMPAFTTFCTHRFLCHYPSRRYVNLNGSETTNNQLYRTYFESIWALPYDPRIFAIGGKKLALQKNELTFSQEPLALEKIIIPF